MSELGQRIAPEDIKVGDEITVLKGARVYPPTIFTILISYNSENENNNKKTDFAEDNSYKGEVLEVLSICLPYIVAKRQGRKEPISFDVRQTTFMRPSPEYIKALENR
jgi:hypothetical protein